MIAVAEVPQMTMRIESRFLSLLTHDLRNPLNAIGLFLRMIEDELPNSCGDARSDLDILRQNVALLARMLNLVSDFARQMDEKGAGHPVLFEPKRMVADSVAEAESEVTADRPPIEVSVAESCPRTVTLDAARARLAMRHALANAVAGAMGSPIRVEALGRDDRLRIEIKVDRPPRQSVVSRRLTSDHFERVLGTEAERLGLDLAIAARASELLGGVANFEAAPGVGSSIVLEWPRSQVAT
jgi:signal transduction histidine kinase